MPLEAPTDLDAPPSEARDARAGSQSLVDALPDAALVLDNRSAILAANTAVQGLFDRVFVGEHIGRTARQPELTTAVKTTLATGQQSVFVLTVKTPFSVNEVLARVKALLRRSAPDLVADVLTFEAIELDRAAHRVKRADRDLRLGPTEYRLILYMMENRGRVLTRQQLIDGVWGRDGEVDERTVDVHIGRLRKSLVQGDETDPIRTVRGGGYVFGEK